MGPVFRGLGLSVAVIEHGSTPEQRRAAYRSDITYITNSELGFDYLRDNMAFRTDQLVLREDTPLNFAIIDEVDSILIDEARTPLIISGPAEIGRASCRERVEIWEVGVAVARKEREAEVQSVRR